ncbi:MAG: hypothetical protein DRQ51_03930 [Gammaproteobacteria bacterium]|nr:MAG: hypothetical protein DRQ51_03930 [Gammaproteobacteria bacterium]
MRFFLFIFISFIILLGCETTDDKKNNDSIKTANNKQNTQNITTIDDDRMFTLVLLAETAYKKNNYKLALKSYLMAVQKTDDLKIISRALSLAIKNKNHQAQGIITKKWQKIEPNKPQVYFMLFSHYISEENINLAYQNALTGIKKSKNKKNAKKTIGSLLISNNNKTIKITVVDKFITKYRKNSTFLYTKAKILFENKEYLSAHKQINLSLKSNPNHIDSLILKSQILFALKKTKQALAFAKSSMSKNKNNVRVILNYASMQIDAKTHNRNTYKLLDKAFEIAAKHNDDRYLYITAVLLFEGGFYRQAEHRFKMLIQAEIQTQNCYYYMGKIKKAHTNYNEALKYFSAVSSGDYNYRAVYEVAHILNLLGEEQAAIDYILRASTRFDDEKILIKLDILMATFLQQQKKYEEGFIILSNRLKNNPNNERLLLSRSLLADKLDKLDIAEQDLIKILTADSKNSSALNALAYILITRFDNRLEEAAVYAKQAFLLEPENPAIVDTFGWLKYKQNQLSTALLHLKKAHKLLFDPEISSHLGEVLWELNRKDEALKIWQKALAKFPEDEVLLKTYQKYKK